MLTERQKVLIEVWQKWCELDKMEFDTWLHDAMKGNEEEELKKSENWNPDWKGDPNDPLRWQGW